MCRYSCRIAARAVAAFLLAGTVAWANVTVRFEPASLTVDPGTIFSVAIVADIPQPLVGWGLDLTIQNPSVVSVHAAPSIGPLWVSAYAPDGDGLAALAFPSSVSGIGVVLATISLSADAVVCHCSVSSGVRGQPVTTCRALRYCWHSSGTRLWFARPYGTQGIRGAIGNPALKTLG